MEHGRLPTEGVQITEPWVLSTLLFATLRPASRPPQPSTILIQILRRPVHVTRAVSICFAARLSAWRLRAFTHARHLLAALDDGGSDYSP